MLKTILLQINQQEDSNVSAASWQPSQTDKPIISLVQKQSNTATHNYSFFKVVFKSLYWQFYEAQKLHYHSLSSYVIWYANSVHRKLAAPVRRSSECRWHTALGESNSKVQKTKRFPILNLVTLWGKVRILPLLADNVPHDRVRLHLVIPTSSLMPPSQKVISF